jgi:Zn finger protein HypA/HybF involved in hydrogenase expression
MGEAFDARCKDCATVFEVREGGSFHFDLLHCELCGKPKSRERNALDLHTDALWGVCSCGGELSPTAPSRCPKCRSTEFEPVGNHTLYD